MHDETVYREGYAFEAQFANVASVQSHADSNSEDIHASAAMHFVLHLKAKMQMPSKRNVKPTDLAATAMAFTKIRSSGRRRRSRMSLVEHQH